MGLNTGGSTSTQTTAPSNVAGQQLQQGQIGQAFNAAGGLGTFAAPSNLYNLTPGEQLFQNTGMAMSLPGAQANRALGYVLPGTPGGDLFQQYFRNFIAPVTTNNAIAGGYGGASGANMEALSRAGETAAMQGLTQFGMPMAQQDVANNAAGLQYAGLQRTTSIQDLARVQNLLQSLTGMLPTSVGGGTTNTTQQGPGLGASLANLGASALLGGTGMGGSSLLGSLLGPSVSALGSGLANLFASSPDSGFGDTGGVSSSDFLRSGGDIIPESDPNSLMMQQMMTNGWGYD